MTVTEPGKPTKYAAGVLALLAVCALALAACGSSGPTKSQYIAKADPICASARAQTAPMIRGITKSAVGLAKGGLRALSQVASGIGQLHSVAASTLEKLQKLEQPSGDHAAIEKFLKPFSEVVAALGQSATMISKGQAQQGFAALAQVRPASQRATSAAVGYGLTECKTVLAAL
jgi:hypothetical protein